MWHMMPVCSLCATIQFGNRARGWRLKHTKTHRHRERHRSSLMPECSKNVPVIVFRGSLYRDSYAPAKCTRNHFPAIRNSWESHAQSSCTTSCLQEIQDLGAHCSQHIETKFLQEYNWVHLSWQSTVRHGDCQGLYGLYAHWDSTWQN